MRWGWLEERVKWGGKGDENRIERGLWIGLVWKERGMGWKV